MRGDGGAEARLCFEGFIPGRVFELGARAPSHVETVACGCDWERQVVLLDAATTSTRPFGVPIADDREPVITTPARGHARLRQEVTR